MRTRALASGLAKFVAVVIGGAALGAGVGVGLSELSGGGDSEAPVTAAPTATEAAGATEPTAEVLSTELLEAETASGQARDRARLSVRVRLSNDTNEPLTTDRPVLVVDAGETEADPAADIFAGNLLEEIGPGDSVTGILRFETAGAVTAELRDAGEAELEIAGLTVPVQLDA